MLKEILVNQIIPQILYVIITIVLGLLTYYIKQFFNAKRDFLNYQREQLIQKIGIDKYNQDVAIAKSIILSIEQQAREHDWGGTVKHAMATKKIGAATGLSEDDIFNIIKATVAELNKNKPKAAITTVITRDAEAKKVQ